MHQKRFSPKPGWCSPDVSDEFLFQKRKNMFVVPSVSAYHRAVRTLGRRLGMYCVKLGHHLCELRSVDWIIPQQIGI